MSNVTLVPSDRVNGDLGVVNAARVSFAKERDEVLLHGDPRIPAGEKGDDRLIAYLASHGHWSPLAHPTFVFCAHLDVPTLIRFATLKPAGVRLIPLEREGERAFHYIAGSLYGLVKACEEIFVGMLQARILAEITRFAPITAEALGVKASSTIWTHSTVTREEDVLGAVRAFNPFALHGVFRTFRIKAPVFVARQLGKHQVDLVWNEVSRRYVDFTPEFHTPAEWRKRASNKKQGSTDETVQDLGFRGFGRATPEDDYERLCTHSLDLYNEMIEFEVCPEQARMVLPQSMMTEWWWTGSIAAFARVVNQRTHEGAQKETKEVAEAIDSALGQDLGQVWSLARTWEGLSHE